MSVVTLLDVKVLNNPAMFGDPYQFEITFESLEPLANDLEWKLTYVGSAQSAEHDQVLDSLLVGPVPEGVNKFVLEADAPNMGRIPNSEIVGVTVILLTCSYDGREFVRVGYYVNNEYMDPELAENPPAKPVIDKIRRNILAEKPRVTRFAIKWDSEASAPPEFPPDQPEADTMPDDEAAYGADEAEDEDGAENAVSAEASAATASAGVPAPPAAVATATGSAAAVGGSGEPEPEGEDAEMGGTEEADANKEDEDEDETGSVDLEGESSEDDDEDEDEGEGEGEGEGDEDQMEVEQQQQPQAQQTQQHQQPATNGEGEAAQQRQAAQADVMVH